LVKVSSLTLAGRAALSMDADGTAGDNLDLVNARVACTEAAVRRETGDAYGPW
jgi:hypothetical protein